MPRMHLRLSTREKNELRRAHAVQRVVALLDGEDRIPGDINLFADIIVTAVLEEINSKK